MWIWCIMIAFLPVMAGSCAETQRRSFEVERFKNGIIEQSNFIHNPDKKGNQINSIKLTSFRGGHSIEEDLLPEKLPEYESSEKDTSKRRRKIRHTSDVVRNILEKADIMNEDEVALRELVDRRAREYLLELESSEKVPSPLKVLHYLAPKVPAIKHSPDFMLRIQTARRDLDSGIAASIISTMALLSIQYEKKTRNSIYEEITKDRRFEQLVECVLCGVDVRRRAKESKLLDEEGKTENIEMEDLLDEEDVKIHEGLSVPDTCRAAWGIAMLNGFRNSSYGGEKVADILTALSLRSRERLLARLQLLRRGELRTYSLSSSSLTEGLEKDTQGLAEDVASAIWTFACVKATTGLRTAPLFEASCSILCQNPLQLRKREQDKRKADAISFEADEVVDKLAKSEDEHVQEELSLAPPSDVDDKDALLHWLSPNEVAGIMWAVALHGRVDNAGSTEEMKLSETASILSEIAFDCIAEWLKEDLEMNKSTHQTEDEFSSIHSNASHESEMHNEHGIIVEVIDAAKILERENLEAREQELNVGKPPEVFLQGTDISKGERESCFDEAIDNIETPSKKEDFSEDVNARPHPGGDNDTRGLRLCNSQEPKSKVEPNFSNHKLCSIVWAATDLHDSLRHILIDIVCEIFVCQGKSSIFELGGGDLANLAWAIARRTRSFTFSPSNIDISHLSNLICYIAERSLVLIEQDNIITGLDQFQAPELGRLMWSIAMIISSLSGIKASGQPLEIRQLALRAFLLADTHRDYFGSEDLARIVWGFLELSDLQDVFRDPSVSSALGRIVAIIETSVLRWECGQYEKVSKEAINQVDVGIRFSSFLGKPRLFLGLLEQRLDLGDDEDDEAQNFEAEKVLRLPLLRDLSLDPATMCKLAHALSRTQESFPEINGAWTFTRIAVRLMSSKQGQLLKVASLSDNIRLAHACAAAQCNGYGQGFVTRLFARRLVQHLNELLANGENRSVSQQLLLTPEETSSLIWSLGQLGVRHLIAEEENQKNAYKRMRIVTSLPLLSYIQAECLVPESLTKLIAGAVTMEMMSSSPSDILNFLTVLKPKFLKGLSLDLCEVAESLAAIKSYVCNTDRSSKVQQENINLKNATLSLDSDQSDSSGKLKFENVSSIEMAGNEICDLARQAAVELLSDVVEMATDELKSMKAIHIRRLLTVFAGLPFEATSFVDDADDEIKSRLKATNYATNLPESAVRAATAAKGSWDALADKSDDSSSRLASLRRGLKSVFFQSLTEEKEMDADSSKLEEVADLLTETATTANLVTDHFTRIAKLTNIDPGILLSSEQRKSVFELSRCQEIIADYRRVDFGTGLRQDRKEDGRRKGIGHQVISRIFF